MNFLNAVSYMESKASGAGYSLKILSFPHSLELNNNAQLTSGFGVLVGEASRDEQLSINKMLFASDRSLGLIFTKLSNCKSPDLDRTTLFGLAYNFIKEMFSDNAFKSLVVSSELVGDNGLAYFGGENEKDFVSLQVNVTIKTKEAL